MSSFFRRGVPKSASWPYQLAFECFSSNPLMQTFTVTEKQTLNPSSVFEQQLHGAPTGRIVLNQSMSSRSSETLSMKRTARETHLRLSPSRAYHREPYPHSPNDGTLFVVDEDISPLPSPNSQSLQSKSSRSYFHRAKESQAYWLGLYFFFNLGLTLYNKGVLVHFPFPYTLTAVHALFGTIGSSCLARAGVFVPSRLSRFQTIVVTAFSVLYAINIVVSNVSLQLVTVPFHQVVRATTPVFTIILSSVLLGTSSSRMRIVSLIPVVAGVGFATYGDYYFTLWGFWLTLLGAVLASLKTILTNVLQSSPSNPGTKSPLAKKFGGSDDLPALPKLNPLEFLYILSPMAFVQCLLFAQMSGELNRVAHYAATEMSTSKILAVAFNGCIAFGLNVVSFSANKKVGALSMTVAANVKQVLTVLLAVLIFDLTITQTNMLGILLTLVGGAWYTRVEYSEKRRKMRRLRAI